jgi:hypothetical protein
MARHALLTIRFTLVVVAVAMAWRAPLGAPMVLAALSSPAVAAERAPSKGRNRLAFESSPYLLQHAANPVNWYPWGEEAFAKARKENKPIFLSIGYSTCYWCHVMERESFSDPETAALMNKYFVSIKVGREERPDVDEIYMTAVQLMTGSGGWPMTTLLTPDLKPFSAGPSARRCWPPRAARSSRPRRSRFAPARRSTISPTSSSLTSRWWRDSNSWPRLLPGT